MATVLLGTVGGIVGSAFGPIGTAVGRALGALAGSYLDNAITNALTAPTEGARLTTTDIQTSTEGSVINRQFGRARATGQVIWATRFLETSEISGGKSSSSSTKTKTYSYFANFAVGLVEGPIAGIGRIWADGTEIDQADYTFRVYLGTETQMADPLIEAKEGSAPAYRGLAYLVFELLPIAEWGNRLPQISVEVFRPVGTLDKTLKGAAIIAGNEFGFDPNLIKTTSTQGGEALNRHTLVAASDWTASIDALEKLAPSLSSVLLVVNWFGTDLRCGSCAIRPMVDNTDKTTTPYDWVVAGLTRSTAIMVSTIDGAAAYGGTPNDASVIAAIKDLNTRGIAVTLLPFIEMDIAAGNTLPDPYSDNAATAGQATYPWRGRITVSPAAGFAGTVDKTAAAATQIAAFVGTAAPGDFSGSGTTISYSGPTEWSYRRFILHYAELAALAGGVDTFIIGTEMIGLTQARSGAATYPFVTALKTLASDCRTLLGAGTKIGYTADWSEWNNHRPADGSGDVLFNLDPLWSDAQIDFIGIDNYFPIADWRDGEGHLDFDPSGPTTIYDATYLQGNCAGGEYFDWYYASDADREDQNRIAIADTDPAGEPFVFRQKDLHGWWANAHHDRPGGVRSGSATSWTAQAKPIRFIEFGCPAVDKAANQPNVFPDPKSSESAWPYYSTGARDDAMQRATLGAILGFYGEVANNPVSSVYGAAMVDMSRSHAWSWDARPWPSFPLDTNWGDAANWENGHWLSGRLGAAPAEETITTILEDAGFADYLVEPIPGVMDGVTVGSITSARSLLESVQPAYQFDAIESDGVIKFIARLGRPSIATLSLDDLCAEPQDNRPWKQTRTPETELPAIVKMTYGDPARDDQSAAIEARRAASTSIRTSTLSPPVIVAENLARSIAEIELHAAWVGRESLSFGLPPSRLALDPGDVVDFSPTAARLRLSSIADSSDHAVSGTAVDPLAYAPVLLTRSSGRAVAKQVLIDALPVFVDGPLLEDDDSDYAGYVGGVMAPFGAGMALYRSPSTSGYTLDTILSNAATIGITTADFYSGPVWRWDRVNSLYLDLVRGTLSSADENQVLGGANMILIENQDGEWEVLGFATATVNGSYSYILTDLLRGLRGTEHAMRDPVPAGSRVILYNAELVQTDIPVSLVGIALNWKAGPASKDIGSDDFTSLTVTLSGKGRRPLSPVHFHGARNAGTGDWVLSWTRRTRIGGEDDWRDGVADVPLGEDTETYSLEILDGPGGAVVRTVALTVAAYTYSAADQVADFGATVTSFSARVAQVSTTFGAGISTEVVIS